MVEEPATTRGTPGVEVPMPTLPLANTVRKEALEEEATVRIGRVGLVEEPSTTRLAVGVVELTPTSVTGVVKYSVTL